MVLTSISVDGSGTVMFRSPLPGGSGGLCCGGGSGLVYGGVGIETDAGSSIAPLTVYIDQ